MKIDENRVRHDDIWKISTQTDLNPINVLSYNVFELNKLPQGKNRDVRIFASTELGLQAVTAKAVQEMDVKAQGKVSLDGRYWYILDLQEKPVGSGTGRHANVRDVGSRDFNSNSDAQQDGRVTRFPENDAGRGSERHVIVEETGRVSNSKSDVPKAAIVTRHDDQKKEI